MVTTKRHPIYAVSQDRLSVSILNLPGEHDIPQSNGVLGTYLPYNHSAAFREHCSICRTCNNWLLFELLGPEKNQTTTSPALTLGASHIEECRVVGLRCQHTPPSRGGHAPHAPAMPDGARMRRAGSGRWRHRR